MRTFLLAATASLACIGVSPALADGVADLIIHGGPIVTMEGDAAEYVEAVVVDDGKIVFVGSEVDALKMKGAGTELKNLEGRTLLPGFIDTWSHIGAVAMQIGFADLSFWSDEAVEDISDIIAKLKQSERDRGIQPGGWVIGVYYDPTYLKENRHPTKEDLDRDFPDNPVMLVHLSGLMGVANSAALKQLGISAETPDPQGGTIVRTAGSREPAGLLQGTAFFAAAPAMFGQPDMDLLLSNLREAQTVYASAGFTTVQDGGATPATLEMFEAAATDNALLLDLVALPSFDMAETLIADGGAQRFGIYRNRLKLGGIVMGSDGGPQEKTALFTEPYLTPTAPGKERGNPLSTQDEINRIVKLCYENNIQYIGYGNGDAGIDMHLKAIELARSELGDTSTDRRSMITHSQFVRDDQLDAYKALGIVPSFFTNHAYMFGDVHVTNLGEERAFFLSPMMTAKEKGLIFTNHTDYPSSPPDGLFTVWTAVNRISRSGTVIGPDERVTPYDAIKAITANAAWMYFEEDVKGSIAIGKLADFVVLEEDPLKADPMTIRDIRVMETIKEGSTVFRRQ